MKAKIFEKKDFKEHRSNFRFYEGRLIKSTT